MMRFYIGALLRDENPEKILKEITQRDNFGTSDLLEYSSMV
jgi:hypothetical protein